MAKTLLKTRQDVEDFIRGCVTLGTGGGGSPTSGTKSLMDALESGKEIGWVDAEDIPDDAITASAYLMGSIAPLKQETIEIMKTYGLTEETKIYTESECLSASITELENYLGEKIVALVPVELGAGNSASAIGCAAEHGILAVDGSYAGRAIPEIPQVTPFLAGKTCWPLSSVDAYGNAAIIRTALNYDVLERIGKKLSEAVYGFAAETAWVLNGKEMKNVLVKGDMTKCLTVGRNIRLAREAGEDPVQAILDTLGGTLLIRGTVTEKTDEDKEGYYWGYHGVTGEGEYEGKSIRIWFKNENHIVWSGDQVIMTSPDSIMLVDTETGEPYTNTLLEKGMKVSAFVLPAVEQFRTPEGIACLAPRHYGIDIDYVSINDVILKEGFTLN